MIPVELGLVAGVSFLVAVGSVVYLRAIFRTRFLLHLVILPGPMIMALSLIMLLLDYRDASHLVRAGAWFFVFQAMALPFIVAWGELFTKRMESIALTGEFELGLPAPSRKHIMVAVFAQFYQNLSKSIVPIEGPTRLNRKLAEMGELHDFFQAMSIGENGEVRIEKGELTTLSPSLDVEPFIEFFNFLVDLWSSYVEISDPNELGETIRQKIQKTTKRHSSFLIEEGIMDRLANGVVFDRAPTGFTDLDKAIEGGIPKGTSTLVCAAPSDERERFLQGFIRRGLTFGRKCIWISSARPPEEILESLKDGGTDNITIIDCYTNRVSEVPTITKKGNIVTTPVELSVVKVALSRELDKSPDRNKRAVVDILPTYLVFTSVEKIYRDLSEMVNDLKKRGYTCLFSLNPYVLKDDKDLLALEELFDNVLFLERIPTSEASLLPNEAMVKISKMYLTEVERRELRVRMGTETEPMGSFFQLGQVPSESSA